MCLPWFFDTLVFRLVSVPSCIFSLSPLRPRLTPDLIPSGSQPVGPATPPFPYPIPTCLPSAGPGAGSVNVSVVPHVGAHWWLYYVVSWFMGMGPGGFISSSVDLWFLELIQKRFRHKQPPSAYGNSGHTSPVSLWRVILLHGVPHSSLLGSLGIEFFSLSAHLDPAQSKSLAVLWVSCHESLIKILEEQTFLNIVIPSLGHAVMTQQRERWRYDFESCHQEIGVGVASNNPGHPRFLEKCAWWKRSLPQAGLALMKTQG